MCCSANNSGTDPSKNRGILRKFARIVKIFFRRRRKLLLTLYGTLNHAQPRSTTFRPRSDPAQTPLNPAQPRSLAQNYFSPPTSSVHYHRHGGTIAGPSSCPYYIEECLSLPPTPLQSTILTTLVLHPTTPLPQQVTDDPQSCIMPSREDNVRDVIRWKC